MIEHLQILSPPSAGAYSAGLLFCVFLVVRPPAPWMGWWPVIRSRPLASWLSPFPGFSFLPLFLILSAWKKGTAKIFYFRFTFHLFIYLSLQSPPCMVPDPSAEGREGKLEHLGLDLSSSQWTSSSSGKSARTAPQQRQQPASLTDLRAPIPIPSETKQHRPLIIAR